MKAEIRQERKPKISTWARLSFWCVFACGVIAFGLPSISILTELPKWIGKLTAVSFFLLMCFAFLSGIMGLIIIIKRKLRGISYVYVGLPLSLAFFAVIISIHPMEAKRMPIIHKAAAEGDLAKITSILSEKPELTNLRNLSERTPLHWATKNGHQEIVKFLIDNGAEVNAKSDIGRTPLHSVISVDCNKEVVTLLLANGADVNAKDITGYTALHLAATYNCKEIIELLMANKANVNAKTIDGETPLQMTSDIETVHLLRKYGAKE